MGVIHPRSLSGGRDTSRLAIGIGAFPKQLEAVISPLKLACSEVRCLIALRAERVTFRAASMRLLFKPRFCVVWLLTISTFSVEWPIEPIGQSSRLTGLVISEIMYHPPKRTDGKKLEFIELRSVEDR
jgi:hypothetical protein